MVHVVPDVPHTVRSTEPAASDPEALAEAVRSGQVGGAAINVQTKSGTN